MTLLDRYMARRQLSAIAKILITLVGFFILVDLLTHRQDNIIKYDIPLSVAGLYYLTLIPTILFEYQAAALAILISGLMVLGKAAQDQEITAALAGGISLRKIVRAPILIALLVGIAAFFIEDTAGVRAAHVADAIEREYFSRFGQHRTGISWTNLGDGWTCHILKFNREANTGEDVFIHRITQQTVEEIRAKKIYWDAYYKRWMLEDGRWFSFNRTQAWEQRVQRITRRQAPFNEPPSELFALEKPAASKSARILAHDLHAAEAMGLPVQTHWVDFHSKFARPALAFVMIWLAIPFAIRLRRGGIAIGFGLSIVIALAYLLLFYISIGLGHLGQLPPILAAWLANAIFLCIGLYLFRSTPT